MTFFPSMSDNASAFDVFAAFPDIYEPIAHLSQTLFSAPGPMSEAERQFIFSYVSKLNDCKYCFGGHAAATELLGIEQRLIEDAIVDVETAGIDAKLKPLLRYVKKLNDTPTRMVQGDADAVLAAGWSEEAFEYAIALCCLANFMNRLVEGHGVEGRAEEFAARAELAIEHGYLEPFLMKTGRPPAPK